MPYRKIVKHTNTHTSQTIFTLTRISDAGAKDFPDHCQQQMDDRFSR
jgi:hypothetical protein